MDAPRLLSLKTFYLSLFLGFSPDALRLLSLKAFHLSFFLGFSPGLLRHLSLKTFFLSFFLGFDHEALRNLISPEDLDLNINLLQRFNFFNIEDVASVHEGKSIDGVFYLSTAFKRVDNERGLILFVFEFKSTQFDRNVPHDYVLFGLLIVEEPLAKTIQTIVTWSFKLELDMTALLYLEFLIFIAFEN